MYPPCEHAGFEICDCECHSDPSIKHVAPCCWRCNVCNRNIQNYIPLPKKTGRLPGTANQPAPNLENKAPASWDLVRADIEARNAEGVRKYGVALKPGNGRDTLVDAYQEALDLVVYLRTAIYERDGK